MNSDKGINPKIAYWFTFIAILVNIVCLITFFKMQNTSGDTGIAMWAIFLFSFFLVSIPLHMGLLVLALVQTFISTKHSFKWLYAYLIITFVGFVAIAAKNDAFDDWFTPSYEPPQLTSAEIIMQRTFNTGTSADIKQVQQALDQGLDANSGIRKGQVPYLVQAASYADAPTIQLLLQAGADPNKQTSIQYSPRWRVSINNASPLDVVMFSDFGNVLKSIELLLASGADPQNTLMKLGACRKGNMALFEYANKLTANAIAPDKGLVDADGKNCIHHAAESNQVVFLQTLLFSEDYKTENLEQLLLNTNNFSQFPLDVALVEKHYGAAIEIVKAGGKANRKWSITQVLESTSQDPSLTELQALLLKQNSEE